MALGTHKAASGTIPLFCEHDCGAGVKLHLTGDIEYTVEPYWPGDWRHPPEGGDVEYTVKPDTVELLVQDEVVTTLHVQGVRAQHWAEFAENELGDDSIQKDCREDAEQRARHREAGHE